MPEFVNTNMVILARESRGITQIELAAKIGTSQSSIAKIEHGEIGISDEAIEKVSAVTQYPVSFFYQQGSIAPENLNFRKREKVAQRLLTPINAKVNIMRLHVQMLARELKVIIPSIPVIEATEEQTPQKVALKLRKLWKVEKPVVDNVTKLLEQNGVVISIFNFNTERVDSRSILTDDKLPIIFLNNLMLGDRQRFSLMHQLGQIIMHTFNQVASNRDVSHEANQFAAEFLMPEKEIRKDFKDGITVPLLGELKRKWKVSMIALLYRADDLGYMTENQKRYVLQQFNELKIRRREPIELDVPVEKPELIRKWLTELKTKQKLDAKGLAARLHLNTDEFIELYN
jgi:Zn-dependent peptidase ImmA (M78 family)/DNA-binding XRE family transcriptional regulator